MSKTYVIEIGKRNFNRLKTGTHKPAQIMKNMGYRSMFAVLPGEKHSQWGWENPRNGELMTLDNISFENKRKNFVRDQYPEEIAAEQAKFARKMAQEKNAAAPSKTV